VLPKHHLTLEHTCTQTLHSHTHECMHTNTNARTHVHTCKQKHTRLYACIQQYMSVHLHTNIHATHTNSHVQRHTGTHVHAHISTHSVCIQAHAHSTHTTCMCTHTHTHTHTQAHSCKRAQCFRLSSVPCHCSHLWPSKTSPQNGRMEGLLRTWVSEGNT
jgi:hypothetical protein